MRLLPVLIILTTIQAKPQRLQNGQDSTHRRSQTNDVDVYPERFREAVDFGHVYRNGYRKEVPEIELDMIKPMSVEHARQLLRQMGRDIVKKSEDPLGFSSPRDAMLYNKKNGQANTEKHINQFLNSSPRTKNLTKTMRKSINEEIKHSYSDRSSQTKEQTRFGGVPSEILSADNAGHKEQFFSKSSFNLMSDETYYVSNWTTCKEFAKRAVFHPDDVINIEWIPFYIWSLSRFSTSVVHTLTYPTKKLVRQYKEKYGPYLNTKIDWDEPKLLLKESKDMLLIAGDRKGLFYGIPHIDLPSPAKNYKIKLPVITIRLKIVDPYLAMMYCNESYATIMSVLGTEPETDAQKTAEAGILKFQGIGNPATRNMELENRKAKHEIERKRREEEMKYIKVERPVDRLDPSL